MVTPATCKEMNASGNHSGESRNGNGGEEISIAVLEQIRAVRAEVQELREQVDVAMQATENVKEYGSQRGARAAQRHGSGPALYRKAHHTSRECTAKFHSLKSFLPKSVQPFWNPFCALSRMETDCGKTTGTLLWT